MAGCRCKKPSPLCQAICSAVAAPMNIILVILSITEKNRWTPFYLEMQCESPPPVAMRFSAVSMPPPLNEALGVAPGVPPYGLYLNITTRQKCTNPAQSSITLKAAGSEIQMLSPNVTDLALGGLGLPYTVTGKIQMVQDAKFAAAGGEDEIVMLTQVEQSLGDLLAGMSPVAMITGYSVSYTRGVQHTETCGTVFGMSMCTTVSTEQFCGSFGGSCLARRLNAAGEPLVPAEFEPALCGYTRSLCGKEADVKALLNPEYLGIKVLGQVQCAGLPNGTLCNVILAPGLNPLTYEARAIEPAIEPTPQALKEFLEGLEKAESGIYSMIMSTLILNACFAAWNVFLVLVCCRRHRRTKRSLDDEAQTGSAVSAGQTPLPTVMTGSAQGRKA